MKSQTTTIIKLNDQEMKMSLVTELVQKNQKKTITVLHKFSPSLLTFLRRSVISLSIMLHHELFASKGTPLSSLLQI